MSIACVCMTVKIQFDNTRICKYYILSYSPSAQSHCALSRLGPLFKNSGCAPENVV